MKKFLLYLSAIMLASCVLVSCDDKPTPEPGPATPSTPKTGKEITSHLLAAVRQRSNVTLIEHFTGWQVVDSVCGALGEIDYVEDSTANTIFCIEGKLVPATEDFIERIDAKERTIYMNLPDGLLDL